MKQILFVTYNRIGDAVLSSGVLAWLADRYPAAKITVACGPAAATLFRHQPGVVRIIEMAKQKRAGHWIGLWKQVAGTRWDLVVDLRASAIAYTLRADRRAVLRPNDTLHRVRHIASVLDLDPPPPPRLEPGPAARAEAARLVPEGAPVLALGPTANWAGKAWEPEKYIELVRRLTDSKTGMLPNARTMVVGAASERDAALDVIGAIPADRCIDLVGKTDLPLTAACLARADFYIGNDSGPMHMAAAMGLPTLGLFGPSPEERYGPWGPNGASVRGPRSFHEIITAPTYDYRDTKCEMTDLDVDKVETAARGLWEKAGSDADARYRKATRGPTIATLTVAHNEETNLAGCLECLTFADERVVVLDRCSDNSKAVAEAAGATRILEGAWPIEGDRRNAGIDACEADWILEVDADERVPEALAREITALLRTSKPGYYLVRFDNYVGTTRVRYGWGAYIGANAGPRLFSRGAKRWGRQRVHPSLELGEKLGWVETPIDHYVDRDISDMLARFDRYTDAHARDLRENGKAAGQTLGRNVLRIFSRFFKSYVSRKGYREGGYGFLVAVLAGLYPIVSWLKATFETPPSDGGTGGDRT